VRYSLQNPHAYVDSNIVGFMNVLEGCRHNGVQHLVYASSSSVYGGNTKMPFSEHDSVDHPVSMYAATKKANELMAHTYSHLFGLPTTGLRFFTVYGPWGRPDMALFLFTKAILEGRPIDVFNHGRMQRDFTYVDDIVEGVIRVTRPHRHGEPRLRRRRPTRAPATCPFRVFNIGNHNPVPLLDYIAGIEEALGMKAEKRCCRCRTATCPPPTPMSRRSPTGWASRRPPTSAAASRASSTGTAATTAAEAQGQCDRRDRGHDAAVRHRAEAEHAADREADDRDVQIPSLTAAGSASASAGTGSPSMRSSARSCSVSLRSSSAPRSSGAAAPGRRTSTASRVRAAPGRCLGQHMRVRHHQPAVADDEAAAAKAEARAGRRVVQAHRHHRRPRAGDDLHQPGAGAAGSATRHQPQQRRQQGADGR
jgi:nucleoside-diphosphate-sugar epimerase